MATVNRNTALTLSKNKLVQDIGCIACKEAFSPVKNKGIHGWSKLMARHLATTMIEDTDGQTLPASARECVINFISGTL